MMFDDERTNRIQNSFVRCKQIIKTNTASSENYKMHYIEQLTSAIKYWAELNCLNSYQTSRAKQQWNCIGIRSRLEFIKSDQIEKDCLFASVWPLFSCQLLFFVDFGFGIVFDVNTKLCFYKASKKSFSLSCHVQILSGFSDTEFVFCFGWWHVIRCLFFGVNSMKRTKMG